MCQPRALNPNPKSRKPVTSTGASLPRWLSLSRSKGSQPVVSLSLSLSLEGLVTCCLAGSFSLSLEGLVTCCLAGSLSPSLKGLVTCCFAGFLSLSIEGLVTCLAGCSGCEAFLRRLWKRPRWLFHGGVVGGGAPPRACSGTGSPSDATVGGAVGWKTAPIPEQANKCPAFLAGVSCWLFRL